LLGAWGIPFTDKNIRGNIETMLEFRRKGYAEVPVVEGAGAPLTEYTDPEQLRAWLHAEGYSV
jgi:hypothetical protein